MDYCKCDGTEICLICRFNIIYRDYQYTIYKNCLNLNFLTKVRENLHKNLLKLVDSNNHFLCVITNEEFEYFHKDWFNGNQVHFFLFGINIKWTK